MTGPLSSERDARGRSMSTPVSWAAACEIACMQQHVLAASHLEIDQGMLQREGTVRTVFCWAHRGAAFHDEPGEHSEISLEDI